MNRPLLRSRLRRRIIREWANTTGAAIGLHGDAIEAIEGSDAIADRVLDRLSAEHGSGGLLDLLLVIDWVKLLEVILAVVQLFGDEPPRDEAMIAASQEAYKRGDYMDLSDFVDELKAKADKEEAEAKRERLADIDGETA